jgi:hypothetical protein
MQATSRLRDSEAKAARIQRELTSLKELQATSALDLSAAHSRAQQAEQELGEAQVGGIVGGPCYPVIPVIYVHGWVGWVGCRVHCSGQCLDVSRNTSVDDVDA